jgi:hypothetical protein
LLLLLVQVWHTGGVLLLAAVIAAVVAVLAAALVLPTLASEQVRMCTAVPGCAVVRTWQVLITAQCLGSSEACSLGSFGAGGGVAHSLLLLHDLT